MGLIIVCRFIPGDRTAVTLCWYPWRRFAVAEVRRLIQRRGRRDKPAGVTGDT